MRRICIYFSKAKKWRSKDNVEWIVCKKCRRTGFPNSTWKVASRKSALKFV